MDYQEYCFNIKLRIATLEAQMDASATELRHLKQIKCPACNGNRNITKPALGESGYTISEPCALCDSTGLAAGTEHR